MPETTSVIHADPDILGGVPVFVGTRVPVKTLIDYLAAGDPLDVFLDHFPTVSREQAVAALKLANELLVSSAAVAKPHSDEVGREMLAYRDAVKRKLGGPSREFAHAGPDDRAS